MHRILRNDYYLGIVTHHGVKVEGRHDALIDQATFDRVQEILDAHAASGDRSHKHQHYLKGALYCDHCGRRLGYGRHRGKMGVTYEYFSCLSRVTRGGRCAAPYYRVEAVEDGTVRYYATERYRADEQEAIRQAGRTPFFGPLTARVEWSSARHAR